MESNQGWRGGSEPGINEGLGENKVLSLGSQVWVLEWLLLPWSIICNTTTHCAEIHTGLDHILPPQTFPDATFLLCGEVQPGCKVQLLTPAPTADIIK